MDIVDPSHFWQIQSAIFTLAITFAKKQYIRILVRSVSELKNTIWFLLRYFKTCKTLTISKPCLEFPNIIVLSRKHLHYLSLNFCKSTLDFAT